MKKLSKRQVYGIVRNGVLTRTVLFKKHFFWKYKGYAFGVEHLKALERENDIQTLKIVERDTDKEFAIPYQEFINKSKLINTRYGRQRVIHIDCLTQIK